MQFKANLLSSLVLLIFLNYVHGLRTQNALRRSEREVASHQNYPSHSQQPQNSGHGLQQQQNLGHGMQPNPGQHGLPQQPQQNVGHNVQPQSGGYNLSPTPNYNRNPKAPDLNQNSPQQFPPTSNRIPITSTNSQHSSSYNPGGGHNYNFMGSPNPNNNNEILAQNPMLPNQPLSNQPLPNQPHPNQPQTPSMHLNVGPQQHSSPNQQPPLSNSLPNALPEANISASTPTGRTIGGAIAGRTFAQLAQFKAAKMALIGQVLGLNGFGVRNEQTAATCTATNSEVFTTSASHMLSLLCMTTVCSPSGPVDLVNGMEFGQCTMSCMSNPKIPLALYVYKNYGNLNENLKFKSDFTSKLPSLLTTNTVIEGIDTLRLSSSGLGSEQIGELTNFKNTLLSKTAK